MRASHASQVSSGSSTHAQDTVSVGWSTTVAATGTTRGSAAMMREAISGLLLGNLRGGFAFDQSLSCQILLIYPWWVLFPCLLARPIELPRARTARVDTSSTLGIGQLLDDTLVAVGGERVRGAELRAEEAGQASTAAQLEHTLVGHNFRMPLKVAA